MADPNRIDGVTGCTEFRPAFFVHYPDVRFFLNGKLWGVERAGLETCWLVEVQE